MNSRETVEPLADLQQKQRVRFTMADGTTVEGRVDQLEYDLRTDSGSNSTSGTTRTGTRSTRRSRTASGTR